MVSTNRAAQQQVTPRQQASSYAAPRFHQNAIPVPTPAPTTVVVTTQPPTTVAPTTVPPTTQGSLQVPAGQCNGNIRNFGGPVVPNARINLVWQDGAQANQNVAAKALGDVLAAGYLNGTSEFNVHNQTISQGCIGSLRQIDYSLIDASDLNVAKAQMQQTLTSALDKGLLQVSDIGENSVLGVQLAANNNGQVQSFHCSFIYNGTAAQSNTPVRYYATHDLPPTPGQYTKLNETQQLTVTHTALMIDTVTNPDDSTWHGDLCALSSTQPQQYEEVTNQCTSQTGSLAGWPVAGYKSVAQGKCVYPTAQTVAALPSAAPASLTSSAAHYVPGVELVLLGTVLLNYLFKR